MNGWMNWRDVVPPHIRVTGWPNGTAKDDSSNKKRKATVTAVAKGEKR